MKLNYLLIIFLTLLFTTSCDKKENNSETMYEFEGTYVYTSGYVERPLIKITKNIERAREITDTTLLDSLVISYDAISLTQRAGIIMFNFRKTTPTEIPPVLAIDVAHTPIKILNYKIK